MSEIIKCADCRFFVEKHYEEDGEEPYVKYACKNKFGMPGYAVKPTDFCSRAEEKKSIPELKIGDVIRTKGTSLYVVIDKIGSEDYLLVLPACVERNKFSKIKDNIEVVYSCNDGSNYYDIIWSNR